MNVGLHLKLWRWQKGNRTHNLGKKHLTPYYYVIIKVLIISLLKLLILLCFAIRVSLFCVFERGIQMSQPVADPENFGGGGFEAKTSKIRMSSPKLRLIFRPKSDIQTFFSPKIRWSPKKKKKKRSSRKLRLIFRPKSGIQTFFSPKIRWSPKKKKKRSSPKLRLIFRSDSLRLGRWGGMHPETEPNYSK